MAVSTTTNRVEYNGNGSTTIFAYPFLITAESQLLVYEVVISTGVATLKTITTHYTVSGVGDAGGGNVTMLSAPASTVRLLIIRSVPKTQAVDYVANDKFPANTHESALDKLTMIVQDLDEVDDRAIQIPSSSTQENFTIPDPDVTTNRGKGIKINSSGDGLDVFTVDSDTTSVLTTKGDLAIYGASAVDRLAVGTDGQTLEADSSAAKGLSWKQGLRVLADALGDLIYGSAADTFAKLAGNITTTRKFLRQVGDGAVSAAPAWDTLVNADLPTKHAAIADQKAAGTQGGTFTSGAWQTRDLNTELYDPDGIVSIAANQFTLAAGTYRIRWIAPAYEVDEHASKLYNVTDAADVAVGIPGRSAGGISGLSMGSTRVTIAGSKAFEIRHRCATTRATAGFGLAANVGVVEQYCTVEIVKE